MTGSPPVRRDGPGDGLVPPSPAQPRAVITGLGVVSAWGWGVDPFWRGVQGSVSAIGPFGRIDHGAYRTHVAAEVPPPPARVAASVAAWGRLSWSERFAVAAGREAVAAAGLGAVGGPLAAAGVFFGSSTGGMLEGEEFYLRLRRAAVGRASLHQLAGQQVSAPAEALARDLGCGGPVETYSSACASGTLALGRALDALRAGEVEVAVAGGADSLCRVTYGGFNALRSVDEGPCRPFRADRSGLSIGEGGAVLVVETLGSARRRGAPVLAELVGSGSSSDAGHMTAPDPEGEGAARALREALADAGADPGRVSFVNAHGTGTPLNDAAEWRALASVFGERATRLPVVATKASVGHLLGSAGAIEAVATVLCLSRGVLHPVPDDGETDPDTPLDLVREARPLPAGGGPAVSLNLAFGGCNAALVFAAGDAAR